MTRTGGLLKYDSQYVMGESLNGYLMPARHTKHHDESSRMRGAVNVSMALSIGVCDERMRYGVTCCTECHCDVPS